MATRPSPALVLRDRDREGRRLRLSSPSTVTMSSYRVPASDRRAYAGAVDEHGAPLELYLVTDNYAAHQHAKVKE